MNEFELRINVYNNSRFGHANVSFYERGDHVYTIGANIRLEVLQLALPQVLPFEVDDGIYRDETAYHEQALLEGTVISRRLPVSEGRWHDLLDRATSLENQTYNYSLFTEACTDLVAEFYSASGHPGAFGDLFAPNEFTGSWVWMRVPVTMEAADPALPPYAPTAVPDAAPVWNEAEPQLEQGAFLVADIDPAASASEFRDQSVRLSLEDPDAVSPDDHVGTAFDPMRIASDGVRLNFGDLSIDADLASWSYDEFVFRHPSGETDISQADWQRLDQAMPSDQFGLDAGRSDPSPQTGFGRHAAEVRGSTEPVSPRDRPDERGDGRDYAHESAADGRDAPLRNDHSDARELSFGSGYDGEALEAFDYSPNVDLAFDLSDHEGTRTSDVSPTAVGYSFGEQVEAAHASEDKLSWAADFWPF